MYLVSVMRIAFLIFIFTVTSLRAEGQRRLFGSIDDPAEQPSQVSWLSETHVGLFGGFSLIGPQWRTEGRVRAAVRTPSFSGRFTGVLRTGLYGTYEPDVDEAYDILRLVDFIRLQSRRPGFYIRAGPLNRTRLGLGHVVNFHRSSAAWDERQIGIEAAVSNPVFSVGGFVDNVELDGLVGVHFSLSPLSTVLNRQLRSLTLAINGVQDRSSLLPDDDQFRALDIEAQIEAWRSGAFSLLPFVSHARARASAYGWMFGADLLSDNFIDTARLHFRVAFHINSAGFLPGYVGPFWQVHSPRSRILLSVDRTQDRDPAEFAGITMDGAPQGEALTTEFRVLIFEKFEFWYRFLRNFSSSSLSEFNLRLFVRARQFRLAIGQDRGGAGSFFSLFNDLGDLNLLYFEVAYRIRGSAWILVDARYTYIRERTDDVFPRYRVQRRFDPLFGFRFSL